MSLSFARLGIASEPTPNCRPVWVFFADKACRSEADEILRIKEAKSRLSERSLLRRQRRGCGKTVNLEDASVAPEYLQSLETIKNVKLRVVSRWLNAVSVEADDAALQQIRNLAFVDRIAPVGQFIRHREVFDDEQIEPAEPEPHRDYRNDYGGSLNQNRFLHAPELHDLMLTGQGILVGLMDAGFNNLDHTCFQDLNLVAAWDFLNDDDNVADQQDDMGLGEHGTKTLSVIAGFDQGHLIGTAYGAGFVLAKTENSQWERPVEEDYWVAALEWMDELGVEVVSSSLTYMDWYSYEDMDGRTGVTTIAAEHAIDRGMVIAVSMGNTGQNHYPYDKMGAPADGFRVFGIGATNRDSAYAPFSSRGPTFDGRIKPDFTTLGSSVRFASDRDDSSYGAGLGTSFSAPALAGLCALLLQADPYLTPVTLRDLLRQVSNNREEPDTLFGWGIPDGLAAWHQLQFPDDPLHIELPRGWSIISSNRRTVTSDIERIMAPLVERGALIILKNNQGQYYQPAFGFNNIPLWNLTEGYQICVTRDEELVFEGEAVNYTEPIELEQGWHIVAYLPDFPMTSEIAFSSLTENQNLVIVKDERGRYYHPGFNFNNLGICQPGEGYQLLVSEATALVYPRQRIWNMEQVHIQPSLIHFRAPAENGEWNMSLLAIAGEGIIDGDEIACVGETGTVVGGGVFRDGRAGMAVWGGANECELPTLQLYSNRLNSVLTPQITFIYGDRHYKPNGFAVIELAETVNYDPQPASIFLQANPNPFNGRLTITYALPDKNVVLSIFDSSGRLMLRESRYNPAGAITCDASSWPSGAYIIRVKNARDHAERLIQLVK